jgi:hypothetical protein
MAKRDKIDHSIEFWGDKRVDRFLLSEPTIELLGRAIRTLKRRKRFGIDHANALTLAVSLIESQMRDCIRRAIDDPTFEFNHESEFLRDIKIDTALLSTMRARRLTLGEFVFLNTGISTVERLFRAVEFCFPYNNIEISFGVWLNKDARRTVCKYSELKSSLAWIYKERNQYVHELLDATAATLGSTTNLGDFFTNMARALDFLLFVQDMKKIDFGRREFSEHHPSRGKVGKQINRTTARIETKIREIDVFLRSLKVPEEASLHTRDHDHIKGLKTSFIRLLSVYDEYITTVTWFATYAFWPGTMANDIAYGVRLEELRHFERRLKYAYENMQQWATDVC